MIGTASLSLSEERLWRAEQAGDGAAPFIECPRAFALVRRLRGPLDVAVLAEVLTELLLRHEVLRSRFLACADGTPMRIIDPPHAVAVPVTDLEPGSDDAVVGRAVAEEIARPIDLTAGLLLRARLLRLADADHVLVIVIHHIVFDGWSCHVFWGEFSAAYRARLTGQPVALPPAPRYVDYVAAQRKWLGSESARLSRQYWAKRLRGAQPSTLPGDREAPAAPTTESGCERFLIAPAEADRLRRFGRDYGAVPAITATALAHRRRGSARRIADRRSQLLRIRRRRRPVSQPRVAAGRLLERPHVR
jgi:hypothetical protein